MIRIILFLILIALAAAGAAWVADQTGNVVLSWGDLRAVTTLPVFALGLGIVAVAAIILWWILYGLWRMPARIRRGRRERRHARGRHAITQGLLAIGHGDSTAARAHARNRLSSMAIARARKPRSAPWPSARIRGCSACADCSSRRSVRTMRLLPS
jgi:uncharacterized membrane-anchored protein